MSNIAILGSRGIPGSYSGFETSIEETSIRLVEKGFTVTVYCRKYHYKNRVSKYKGVQLKYLPSIRTKHFDTISHTFLSFIHSIICSYNIIILYGLGNSLFIPLFRIFGKKVISVVDGADWERKKWGSFAKWYLKTNRYIAVKISNYCVVDNEYLANDYMGKYKQPVIYIPYGASSSLLKNGDITILDRYNLRNGEYIIFVGRFVKEKGIEFLIENFKKVKTSKKLVIVGGNSLDKDYELKIKNTNDERIVFTGFLYGNQYETLLKYSHFYVSCSYLEGTSPSLLNAMSINGFALVSDIKENIETLKGTCATFRVGNSKDFVEKLQFYLNNPQFVEGERSKTKEIVEKYYNWDKITNQYIELINNTQN